jgi:hypothetical protein
METTTKDLMTRQAATTSVNNNIVYKADKWEY